MATAPSLHITTAAVTDLDVDVLILPVFRGGIEGPGTDVVLRALGLDEVLRTSSFRARPGETLDIAAPGMPFGRVTLVGLGRMDQLSDEMVRRAAGSATRAIAATASTAATTLAEVDASAASIRAAAEGTLLGAHRFDDSKSDPTPTKLTDVSLVVPSSLAEAAGAAIARAQIHAQAQIVARDLVTTAPNTLGPHEFAERAQQLASDQISVDVWDQERLAAESCGGLLAVARGSAREPKLVRLHYRPAEPVASIALVGKGITFDTGGISLKRPSRFMESMKGDMAGAAAVLAVFSALADLEVPVEVFGELCLAENMPGADAQRPSDVIEMRNGTTVEVRNTDAEGRLVLADGLALSAERGVDAIIDIATLTGAAARALGKRATAVFTNDDDLLRQLLAAAHEAGEAAWHLPLWEDLRDNLESDVADLDNLGEGDEAGATMAGLFLREFVDGTPWAHLDIAGPFWQDAPRFHLSAHGTGVSVRTLLRWIESAKA